MAPRLLFHFNCYSALNCSIKCGPWHGGNNGLIRGHFHLIRRNKLLAAVQWCSPRLALLKAFLGVMWKWREMDRQNRTDMEREEQLISVSVIFRSVSDSIGQQNFHVSFDIQKLTLCGWSGLIRFLMASFLSSSHHYAVVASLTNLKLAEVMALPHVAFRREDCWHHPLCPC